MILQSASLFTGLYFLIAALSGGDTSFNINEPENFSFLIALLNQILGPEHEDLTRGHEANSGLWI